MLRKVRPDLELIGRRADASEWLAVDRASNMLEDLDKQDPPQIFVAASGIFREKREGSITDPTARCHPNRIAFTGSPVRDFSKQTP